MKFNVLSISLFSFALTLSACSDDFFGNDAAVDDNVVKFVATDVISTRADGASVNSLYPIIPLFDSNRQKCDLAIDVREENISSRRLSPSTRTLPLLKINRIAVKAFLPDGRLYFEENDIKPSGEGDNSLWIPDNTHYWPAAGALDFYALSLPDMGDNMINPLISSGSVKFSYTPFHGDAAEDAARQPDIALAFTSTAKTANGSVPLRFAHALAGLSFTAQQSDNFKIKKITIRNLVKSGDCEYFPKNEVSESPFLWNVGEDKTDYSQSVSDERFSIYGDYESLIPPFMIIPQRMDDVMLEVVAAINGTEQTVSGSLSTLRDLKPGKIYRINIAQRNALYPPVENLKYMLGHDTDGNPVVTLSWDNPDEPFPYIHRNRLVVVDNANPGNEIYLDRDAKIRVLTEDYERMEYSFTVYIDYTNDNDPSSDPPALHRSIGRTITFSNRVTTDAPCAYFLPQGYDVTDPVGQLKDDDDQASAYWYKGNASRGRFVNRFSLEDLDPVEYPVLWVPSGIKQGQNDYNADGGNHHLDCGDYFTAEDREAIREYYYKGGNLLLTGFSVALLYDFGVIPEQITEYHPYFVLWNEIFTPAVWFVRGKFGSHDADSHPIYRGLTKIDPAILPYDQGIVIKGDNPVPMFPLLSPDAELCENNNIVWDFTDGHQSDKIMEYMENDCNMKFIGTWGQISDDNVGTVAEFHSGNHPDWTGGKYHGRCICIGLGAFEYNNGKKFDPNAFVKNRYQSNMYIMTANALEYLANKKSTPVAAAP